MIPPIFLPRLHKLLLLLSLLVMACSERRKSAPAGISEDSTSPASVAVSALPDSSRQTPYECALRSLRAMESGNLPALIPYVHPVKGLMITHVGEYISGHEKPFSVAELQQQARQPTVFTIADSYEESMKRSSKLNQLLQLYATAKNQPGDTKRSVPFSSSKDVRRNYTGNGTYILQPPLAPGQTTISFHVSDSANDMNWQELVLRTETYQNKDYLVEVLRAYWTP